MRRTLSAWGVALLVLLVAGACDPPPDRTLVVYRLEIPGGATASAAETALAQYRLTTRFSAARYDADVSTVKDAPGTLVVAMPKDAAPALEMRIRDLARREPSLAIRIRESRIDEKRLRALGPGLKLPPGLAWIPSQDGSPDVLVEIPEAPHLANLSAMKERSLDVKSPEFVAETARYDAAVQDSVFTLRDVASASVVSRGDRRLLKLELADDRKSRFEGFTERHVGDVLVFVLDGQVIASLPIQSKLPGTALLDKQGAAGFAEVEARDLAACLGSGLLPGRLVHVETREAR